jgi:uncharacterized membrane protein HdeD (DUF308 family)
MLEELGRNWGLLAFRGVLAILFGLIAWIWPGITVTVMVILFGVYALVDGVFAVGAAVSDRESTSRVWLAVVGVAGIILGVITLFRPGDIAVVLLILIAWWAVITGLFEIIAAISLRDVIQNEWFYLLSGCVSVLFGIVLFLWPAHTVLGVIWLIGLFSILFGAGLLVAAFRLRRFSTGSSIRA